LVSRRRYLWHYSLHQQVAAERLYFLGVQFIRGFTRNLALEQLERALSSANIPSYVIWELIGSTDILIKLWLPPHVEYHDLEAALSRDIARPHEAVIRPFSVDELVHHWLWREGVEASDKTIPPRHLSGLNDPGVVPEGDIARYQARGIIALPEPEHSIKFFSRIVGEDVDEAPDLTARLRQRVLDTPEITHVSIFRGRGAARYIVSGRVLPDKWEHITDLTDRLNIIGDHPDEGMRTITYVAAFSDPLRREERLVFDTPPALKAPEEEVEVTRPSAAGIPVVPASSPQTDFWDKEDSQTVVRMDISLAPEADLPTADVDSLLADHVTALLNAAGGHVILRMPDAPTFEDDQEYPSDDVPPPRPPEDDQRLINVLTSRIEPNPMPWVTIASHHYPGRHLVVVSVLRPDRWFYARATDADDSPTRFLARQGHVTTPLHGPRIDEHRKNFPRTTRIDVDLPSASD
jgi:hypothetical protein